MSKQKEVILINSLWKIRQGLGLERKLIARLLGHHSTDPISRYERGVCLPSLKTVFKLMIIYQTRLEILYPEHHECYRAELQGNLKHLSGIVLSTPAKTVLSNKIHNCTYEILLETASPKKDDLDLVRSHVTKLARTLIYH